MSFSSLLLLHLRKSKDIFPMLTLRRCVSDAEGSGNGPRYSAQDKITGSMYEVRCIPLSLQELKADNDTALQIHQKRLDMLIAASRQNDLLSSVSLPIDAYMHRMASSKQLYVVSVSAFAGLSLGDVIRSGCKILEKTDFDDILRCVEAYGLESMRLPPHGNLGPGALLRQLTVRSGAVELKSPSRWVIGDWLLLGDKIEPTTPGSVVRDLEWLLHLAFSKLNVLSDSGGIILDKSVVEMRINETVENIRMGLMTGVRRVCKALSTYHLGTANEEGKAAATQFATDSFRTLLLPSEPTLQKVKTAKDDDTVGLLDRIALHKHKLREEQQMIKNYINQRKESVDALATQPPNGGVIPQADSPRRRVRFVEKLQFDGYLNSITLITEQASQLFGAHKDAVLTSLTAALDVGINQSVSDRKEEHGARCKQRDALLSMLMRLAVTLAKRNTSRFGNTSSADLCWRGEVSSKSRNLYEVVELPLHSDSRVDNGVVTTSTSSSSARKLRRNLRHRASSLHSTAMTRMSNRNTLTPQLDVKGNMVDTTCSGALLTPRKKVLSDLRNTLSTRENGSNRNLKNDRKSLTLGATSFLNRTEKSSPTSGLRQLSSGKPNRRSVFKTAGKSKAGSQSRQYGLSQLPRNQIVGNGTLNSVNNAAVQRTLRKSHQPISPVSYQLCGATAARFSPNRLNCAGGFAHVSGGRVQLVNEA